MTAKKLGFGLMRLPIREMAETKRSVPTNRENGGEVSKKFEVDFEKSCAMVDEFLANGFTYFDTSYVYLGGTSEHVARKILVERYPRESFTLATKFPTFFTPAKEKISQIFEEQIKNCGVDFFDYYLVHNVQNHLYEPYIQPMKLFEYFNEQKKAGRIRNLGFSFHDSPELLDKILTEHPEVDFVQIVLNYYDWDSYFVRSRRCYETIRKHGKKVVAMQPVKAGTLADIPAEADKILRAARPDLSPASWAVRFAASLDGVICSLSGMNTLAQVRDNISYMKDFQPLTENEIATLKKIVPLIRKSGPLHCEDFSQFEGIDAGGAPVAGILEAYNNCFLQPDPTYATEHNYYKTFRLEAKIPAGESWIKNKIVDKNGNNITEIVKKAETWLLQNSF